jgi:hypothetical protein
VRPPAPNRWTLAWLLILGVSAVVEVAAAIRKHGGTLSETVWTRWFPRRWQRWLLAAFMVEVALPHFLDAAGHWWSGQWPVIALAVSVAACIIVQEWRLRR